MFGYIRPFTPELKVKEAEAYKACYCGLCRTLFHEYGVFASFAVNYDMVFAVMLLSGNDVCPSFSRARCAASPFRKKCYVTALPSLKPIAAATVINVYYKLCDDASDEGFFKRIGARLLRLFVRRGYQKAVKNYPEMAFEIENGLALYSRLEKEGSNSIDRMTDAIGKSAAGMAVYASENREELMRILYNQARFITLADALDDYDEDTKRGRYNLLAARYGALTPAVKKDVRLLILHIMNEQYDLLKGLKPTPFHGLIENILTLGVDHTMLDLLSGRKRTKREKNQ